MSIIADIFASLKNWQKALIYTFFSYVAVLFFIIVAIVFILKGFSRNLPIVIGVSIGYMTLLFIAMAIGARLFKKRLIDG